jgi:ATP/maltotriose-dependent transcriptional regulator MalT
MKAPRKAPELWEDMTLNLDDTAHKALEELILNDPNPITIISAPAGAGKTYFLNHMAQRLGCAVEFGQSIQSSAEWILWDDVGPDATLPKLRQSQRLIIACRPNCVPASLSRDILYRTALVVGPEDLKVQKGSCHADIWEKTRGWRLLMSPAAQDDRLLIDFISTQILPDIETRNLWAIWEANTYPEWCVAAIPPLSEPRSEVGQRLVTVLRTAIRQVLASRFTQTQEPAPWLAQMAVDKPAALRHVIKQMLDAGEHEGAAAVLVQSGGWYLVHSIGLQAFKTIIDLFPAEQDTNELVFSRAMIAIKGGGVQQGIELLVRAFGPRFSDPLEVFKKGSEFPCDVQIFRIVVMIYEDVALTDQLMDALFDFASQVHARSAVQRGTYFNAMLEFLLRLRRYDEADGAAARAIKAYEEADVPLLSFYISVHRVVMRLIRGESVAANQYVQAARQSLSQVQFESPGDERLLTLIDTIQDYENGSPSTLLRFLEQDLDKFSLGELWPSLVELVLIYGSQALSEQVSTRAALMFLDRWQLYMVLNRQFRHMIELRKVQILQNMGRWGEAEMILASIQARLNRVWVESAEGGLSRIVARDEIALAMSWLRQIVYERPRFPYLDRKLLAMRQNPRLTERQRISIDIWSAFVARKTRDHGRARALLLRVFEISAQRGSLSILNEEHIFLAEMIAEQRLADFLDSSSAARAVRRRLLTSRQSGAISAARSTLTGQELRVLMMLTEGASNKGIARRIGLSEPTVKFHLRNLYRKLGVNRRAEAVAAARSLGWLR